jgi:23S rRNA (adenine2030-N6)-methyltransferase
MLAYRHLFHAGNFADVFKHALLAQLVLGLKKKDKAFFYLDTHAGIGRYDLAHDWARKNAEFENGIARLWQRGGPRPDVPPVLTLYLDALRAENPAGVLRWYPGSPALVRRWLRADDRMALTELNAKDCETLTEVFAGDKQVQVRCMDGYQALKAFLPPAQRRGLILIDSSFDRAREFHRLKQGLVTAHEKFATGVYALWYPLMEPHAMRAFEREIVVTGIRKILQLEISVLPEHWSESMRGCGLLVVNPPFGFEAAAREILDWLCPLLAQQGGGEKRLAWLVKE